MQYMVLSVPNSGTDWFCDLVAEHSDLKYYRKEFFNPIMNRKHQAELSTCFGCETIPTYRNIAVRAEDQEETIEGVYRRTWLKEDFNFDKENFSAFKARFFARHFDVVFLYRSPGSLFPPTKVRAWDFFEAMASAYHEAGLLARLGTSIEERARQAYWISWNEMFSVAEDLGLAVVDYDRLITGAAGEIQQELEKGWLPYVLDIQGLKAGVLKTRQTQKKSGKISAIS